MPAAQPCQVSVWDDAVELSIPRRENTDQDINRRRISTAAGLSKRCFSILQIILAILIVILFGIVIAIPIVISQNQNENNNNTTSITMTTTSITTATTTSTTSATITTATTTSTSVTTSTSISTSTTSASTTTETTVTTTTYTTTTTACYSGDDYVNLVEGGRRRISNLKTGDRVWSLSNDGQHLIKDEIFCITHAGPNTPAYFYTFTTIEDNTVSLTDSHFILVIHKDENKMKFIPASQVTHKHQLIMTGRTISIKNIVYSVRTGFYSPITLSGYLLVNNISTSVYSDILQAPHDFLHQIAGFGRMYYHMTRWLFGNDYIPFETSKEEAKINPVSQFVIDNYEYIRFFFLSFPFITLKMSMILVIYLIHRIFFHETNYYQQFYLKMKHFINKLTISLVFK